jgi:hypothetical protein
VEGNRTNLGLRGVCVLKRRLVEGSMAAAVVDRIYTPRFASSIATC